MFVKTICKCDMCGNETDKTTNVYISYVDKYGHKHDQVKLDLCLECAEKLRLFLRNEENSI